MNAPLGPHNVHEHLSAFADGELDPAQYLAVLDYLQSHPEAFGYLRDRQLLRQSAQRIALKDERDRAMPDALKARLNRLAAEGGRDGDDTRPPPPPPDGNAPSPPPPPTGHGRRWWGRGLGALALAASLALGLLVGGIASRDGHGPLAAGPATRPASDREDADVRDAAIPVALVRAATSVHVDCSRLAERLHAGGYPLAVASLASLVKADLGSTIDHPDLAAIGYHFVGAGPCAKPLDGTVHLLYRKDGPEPRATISLFAQAGRGQFGMTADRLYRIGGDGSLFPAYAWQTERVVYFLIADDEEAAAAARHQIPGVSRRVGA